jgi:hypothetical protein
MKHGEQWGFTHQQWENLGFNMISPSKQVKELDVRPFLPTEMTLGFSPK